MYTIDALHMSILPKYGCWLVQRDAYLFTAVVSTCLKLLSQATPSVVAFVLGGVQSFGFGWPRPSAQFDIIMIKFWLAIVENCTENGHGPAVICSSGPSLRMRLCCDYSSLL